MPIIFDNQVEVEVDEERIEERLNVIPYVVQALIYPVLHYIERDFVIAGYRPI